MEDKYKICFLGHSQLSDMAIKSIEKLQYTDTQILVADCDAETLPKTVDEAVANGYEVFVAGFANAAAFSRYSTLPLVEIVIRDIDYLLAIKKALAIAKKPAVVRYSFARKANIELLSQLCETPVTELVYEDSTDLYHLIAKSDCDVIIGASHACLYAQELGKKNVFLYGGEETVLRTISRARTIAIEQRKIQRSNEIVSAIVKHSPSGIIVTDQDNLITLINKTAQQFLNITQGKAIGAKIEDIAPNLAIRKYKDQTHFESFKIIQGVRFNCAQDLLYTKNRYIGMLTNIRIDNKLSKKDDFLTRGLNSTLSWKNIVCHSQSMKLLVEKAKMYAKNDMPIAIYNQNQTESESLCRAIHSESDRDNHPIIFINTAAISENDAGRVLLGCDDQTSFCVGMLENCNNSTIVLQNFEYANPVVKSCISELLSKNQITRVGAYYPIPVNIKVITLLNSKESNKLLPDNLLYKITPFTLEFPDLADRKDDLLDLFKHGLQIFSNRDFKVEQSENFCLILQTYSWKGGVSQLYTSANKFCNLIPNNVKINSDLIHKTFLETIDTDQLLNDILGFDVKTSTKEQLATLNKDNLYIARKLLRYTSDTIAKKLNLSRTSLWRIINE